MGLFRRAGRRVERLRRSVESEADDAATHACVDCGERFYAERDACEACGGEVAALDADGPAGDADEAPDDDGAGAAGEAPDDAAAGDDGG